MNCSSVKFLNVQNFEADLDKHCKISIEYAIDKGVDISPSDWIAIYPNEALEVLDVDLKLMVTYEFVLGVLTKKDERRYKMEFSLKGAKNFKYGRKYQFVYMSRTGEIYGISEIFVFRPPALNKVQDESSFSQEKHETSKENTEDNCQVLLKVESDKSDTNDKGGYGDQNMRGSMFINKYKKNKQVFVNKVKMCPNNGFGVHRVPPPISCSNCHRVAGLLRAQDELYTKIKNLAEMNSDLQNQIGHLQRRLELSQAAYQKLWVTLMRERQVEQFYQAAAYEYQIMLVEPIVPIKGRPRHPGERRGEENSRGYSFLKLKAIIGHQEEKIRSLFEEIAQLRIGQKKEETNYSEKPFMGEVKEIKEEEASDLCEAEKDCIGDSVL